MELEGHRYYLESQDIVIMRSESVSDTTPESEEQIVYYMDVLKDHSSGEYISLSRYIEDYHRK